MRKTRTKRRASEEGQHEEHRQEQETKSAGILTKTEGLPMAGASRRVSPSGWLWNVCPRSPPRHRIAAAPSLTVVTTATVAVSPRKARQGAAATARTQGLAVVRPCVSPQTFHHRLHGTLRRILRGWTAEKSDTEEGAGGGERDQV